MNAERVQELLVWNRWANAQVFAVVFGTGGEPRTALAAAQHILETEIVWFRRIAGDDRPMVQLWAQPSLDLIALYAPEVRERTGDLVGALETPGELERVITYKNSTGTEFNDVVVDVLTHMLMHSSQYRGEAAGILNNNGFRVSDLDLIFWRRSGMPA